jgi:hypothetical protein
MSASETPVPTDGTTADSEETVAHDLHSVMNIEITFTAGTTIDGVSVGTVLAQSGLDFPEGTDVYTAYVTTPEIGRDLQTDWTKLPKVIPMYDLTWLTIGVRRLVRAADLGVRGSEPLILHTNRGS